MWNTRETAERRLLGGADAVIAVAVDKDKTSQHALRWAADNIVTRDQTIKLIHVRERSPGSSSPSPMPPPALGAARDDDTSMERQSDQHTMEILLPFRCFCRRRQIQCESVILEDPDVAKALIEYVCQNGVTALLLGAVSRNGLSRIFKPSDIPGSVLKWAPDFCTVYVVSKGKINTVRNATRPVPSIPAVAAAPFGRHNTSFPSISTNLENEKLFDELSAADFDVPVFSPGRPSTDSMCFAFYENLGHGMVEDNTRRSNLGPAPDSLRISDAESEEYEPPLTKFRASPGPSSSSPFNRSDRILLSLNNTENVEDKVKRLETELNHTMNMYHEACKEALAAKQKAMELEQWKKKEERELQETILAEDTAMQLLERERTKCKMATEAAEAAQKLVEIEVRKRMRAEMKAHIQAEDKNIVLDALSQAQIALKYQSLFHMVAVLFLFYVYFSLFS